MLRTTKLLEIFRFLRIENLILFLTEQGILISQKEFFCILANYAIQIMKGCIILDFYALTVFMFGDRIVIHKIAMSCITLHREVWYGRWKGIETQIVPNY